MTNSNYKSLGSILYKILRNPLCAELTYEDAAEYALECIKLLGAPVIYTTQNEHLQLISYKASLPCNLLYINGIRYFDCDIDNINNRPVAMRESTNVYHLNPEEFDQSPYPFIRNNTEFTYKIQNGIIFTSMEKGILEISYESIATDEDGYPLIPDNEKTSLALEYYIMSRYLEPLYLVGKITDKAYEYIQQKRYFYIPSAYTSLQMPGVDKMESIMNGLNRLIINNSAHQNFFKKYGDKEKIKKHR